MGGVDSGGTTAGKAKQAGQDGMYGWMDKQIHTNIKILTLPWMFQASEAEIGETVCTESIGSY